MLFSIVLLDNVCAKELISLLLAIKLKLATKSGMYIVPKIKYLCKFFSIFMFIDPFYDMVFVIFLHLTRIHLYNSLTVLSY
jgi:hypothetical protein